jgi:hypothetical protein
MEIKLKTTARFEDNNRFVIVVNPSGHHAETIKDNWEQIKSVVRPTMDMHCHLENAARGIASAILAMATHGEMMKDIYAQMVDGVATAYADSRYGTSVGVTIHRV